MKMRSKSYNNILEYTELSKTLLQIRQELQSAKYQKKANMGDHDQSILLDLWVPQDQNTDFAPPTFQANNFELKPALISMVQHNQFSGSAMESPHTHIRNFLEYCNTMKFNGVSFDVIRLQMFPFSLRDDAKMRYHSLLAQYIDTWPQLVQAFYGRYFPPAKAAEYRENITRFVQFDGEILYDAWQRFQGLIKMCPNHGQASWLILQTFYKGLTQKTRAFVDSAAGGGIMHKTLGEATELIERMASHDFSWTNERAVYPHQPQLLTNPQHAIAAQVEIYAKQLTEMVNNGSSPSNVSAVQSSAACLACGIPGHQTHECTTYLSKSSMSEVNYAQNQSPYSQSYNPSWRNHPNISYRNGNSQYNPSQQPVQGFRVQPNPSHSSFRDNQSVSSMPSSIQTFTSQSSEMNELLRVQKEMMAGIQELVKNQKNLMVMNMQQMKIGVGSSQASNDKLPSQPVANPKSSGHCGAISSVEAVTTRAGTVTAPVIPSSSKQKYVTPPLRTVASEKELHVKEKSPVESPSESVVQKSNAEKITPPPKVPFPERLEKGKEEKQYAKFLEKMKEVQVTIPILDAVLHVPMYARFLRNY